jgi:hypothetical protein
MGPLPIGVAANALGDAVASPAARDSALLGDRNDCSFAAATVVGAAGVAAAVCNGRVDVLPTAPVTVRPNGESAPVGARNCADAGDARYVAMESPPAAGVPEEIINGRARWVMSSGVGVGDCTVERAPTLAVSARKLAMYGCFNNRPTVGRVSTSTVKHSRTNSDSNGEN